MLCPICKAKELKTRTVDQLIKANAHIAKCIVKGVKK